MQPNLQWNSTIQCNTDEMSTYNGNIHYPAKIPYGDACWSNLDYVGDYVNLPFLMDVLRGDKEAVRMKSGKSKVKVVRVQMLFFIVKDSHQQVVQ